MDGEPLQKIIEQARGGSADAWRRLHALCQPKLLADAQRLLGKNWHVLSPRDLTQETWLRARLHLDSYRGAGFYSWLGAIMRNVYRNVIRKRRDRSEPLSLLLGPDSDAPSAQQRQGMEPAMEQRGGSQSLQDEETAMQIHEALAALPADVAQILKLSLVEPRLSFAKIGEELGLTAKQVTTRYHQGIEMLRRKLRGRIHE